MNKISLVIGIFFSIFHYSYTQISHGGSPLSFDNPTLQSIEYNVMQDIDLERLRREDKENQGRKDMPFRFGENIMVDFDIKMHGKWDLLNDGSKIWRLGIRCNGAKTINLTFDEFRIPKGGKLFVYNEDHSEVIGAFNEANNQQDLIFATQLINGSDVIIEYNQSADINVSPRIHLNRVTHGYRGNVNEIIRAFGSAGSCNLNVVCPQSAGWENQIRSAAMLVTGGNGFCSGALINNTNNDATPYFLSADHCFTNPGSVVFYFNWQSATCPNPPSSPAFNSVSGAVTKARNSTSDFWLMQLNTAPPQSYNPYYSGWNRTLDASISGTAVGIHHPSGDIKKFSYAESGVTTSNYGGGSGSGTSHWRVGSWSGGTTTEGGSSGSPLYDPNKRIIGQLHGGSAACGNTLPDWYGNLGISWTGGGTDATRLSTWLDPANTAPMVIDGYDPFATPCITANGGTVNLSNTSYCGTASFTITGSGFSTGTGSTYQWQKSSDYVFTNPIDIAGQTSAASMTVNSETQSNFYRLKVSCATNTSIAYSNVIGVTVNPSPTAVINQTSPLTICAPSTQMLTSTTNANTPTYQWLQNNIAISGATSSTFEASSSGDYKIEVSDANGCKTTSTPLNLTIQAAPVISPQNISLCLNQITALTTNQGLYAQQTTYSSPLNLNLQIPDVSSTGVSHTINVNDIPAGATIDSILVTLNLDHEYSGDVEVNLQAPNGQIINLFGDRGGSSSLGFVNTKVTSNTTFPAFSSGSNPYSGKYRPDAKAQTALIGTPAITTQTVANLLSVGNGDWILRAYDDASSDIGSLKDWKIKIAYKANLPITWSPVTDLFKDAAATIPYDGGQTNTVYAKPQTNASFIATNSFGCKDTTLFVFDSIVTNISNNGSGSLRDRVSCAPAGSNIYFLPTLEDDTITLLSFLKIDKHVNIEGVGLYGIYITGDNSINSLIENFASGNLGLSKVTILTNTLSGDGRAIKNEGILRLKNVNVFEQIGASLLGSSILNLPNAEMISDESVVIKQSNGGF